MSDGRGALSVQYRLVLRGDPTIARLLYIPAAVLLSQARCRDRSTVL